jgi:hypothetical protein
VWGVLSLHALSKVSVTTLNGHLQVCMGARANAHSKSNGRGAKEAWVKDHMQLSNGSIQWNVPFLRAVQDWEVEAVTVFFGKLYAFRRRMGVTDCMLWNPSKRNIFEVKSFFRVLSSSGTSSSSFPSRSIWKVKVPLRVNFFVWMATLGNILTLDNMCKRGIIVVGWCCMCKQSGESINHLLHCEVAQALWSVVLALFYFTWIMFGGVADLLMCLRGQLGNISAKEVWRIAPLCLM